MSKSSKILATVIIGVVVILTIAIYSLPNFSYDYYESDQFGPFSSKTFPIAVDESPIAKTMFQLSEKVVKEESKVENGSVPIRMYEQDYGSYPIITTELDATRLTTAFAMSILGMDFETASKFTLEDKTVMPYLLKYQLERSITFNVETDTDKKLCQTKLVCEGKYADLSIVSGKGLGDLMLWSKKTETDIVYNIFATDALVIFTSTDNPVDSITKEQLVDIYEGKIKNWSKLEGENRRIKLYERSVNSAAQKAFEKYVLNQSKEVDWDEILNTADGEDDREEYINSPVSIGYCLKSQFDITYAKDNTIKLLKIDNLLPTEENILNGSYPLWVSYHYVYKLADKSSIGGQFADWIQTSEGEKCIRSVGLIPAFNEIECAVIDGQTTKYRTKE